jgi:TldD protein
MKNPPSLAFEDHFNISLGDFQNILNTALSRGGDFSEIYLEYKIHNFINMEEDIIKETAESISLGLGIRVLSGEKTGYGYTNDLSFEKIKKAAITAASIASSRTLREAPPLSPVQYHHNFYPVQESPHKESLEKKISIVKEAYHSAQNFDRKIKKVKVSLLDYTQFVTILNSEGLKVSDVRPLMKLACLAIAEKGDKREAGFSGGGGRVGMEYFSADLIPKQIGQDAAKEALELLEADLPPAGRCLWYSPLVTAEFWFMKR